MKHSRREYLSGAASAVLAGLTFNTSLRAALAEARGAGLKIGMCDWTMNKRNDTAVFALAEQIGLDGVEVDIGPAETGLRLRKPEVQKEYLNAARKHGQTIPSIGLLELNTIPLMSEPRAAIWALDAISVAKNLGARSILIPFFAKGELKEDSKDEIRRVAEALCEIAPRAEKAGVCLGFESYLSAETHLRILEQVKSPAMKVYYDVFNAAHAKHDPIRELKLLGADRICQVHFKDHPYLERGSGTVDWPAVVAALKEIRYPGWIVLEIGGAGGDFVADARKNMAYVRKLFAA